MRPGDRQPYAVREPLSEGADLESVASPQPQVIKQTTDQMVAPAGPKSLLHLNKWAVIATTGILLLVVTIGVITLWSSGFRANTQSKQPASNYGNKNLPLDSLSPDALLQVTQATKLNINGELKVGNTFVLTPTATPSTPNVGQIYYDKDTNTPYVYNGSTFVSLLDGPRIESVDGITGALTLGGGLQLIGNQLALSAAAQQSIGVRVTTLQGQSGDVIITGGTGISVNGTTISNTGVTQILGSSGLIVAQSGGLATVSLPQLLGANDTPTFLGVQLNNALQISSGGTNTNGGSYISGGVFYFNGTNFTTTPSPASNGLCLQSGPSGPIFGSCSGGSNVTSLNGASGALILDNATAVADHIVINDASSVAKGIASFNSTDFSVASGAVSLQNTVTKAGNTFNGSAQLLKLDSSGQATLTGQCLLSTASGVAFSNCPGGGDISSGTAQSAGYLTKFDAVTNKITNSIAAESPGQITVTGVLAATYLQGDGSAVTNLDAAKVTTGTLSVARGGTGQISFVANGLLLGNGTSGLSALAPGAEGSCLVINGGVPIYTTCTGAGGVSKLNNATGALTIANASASGATITIDTADTAGTKGIASYNSTNFSVSGGVVNTVQNINNGANVQFASVVLTGTTALTIGQGSTNTGVIAFQNSTNGFSTTLLSGVPLGNLTFTLPSADGTTGQCLKTNALGVLGFGDCLSGSGAGGGVSSLQGTTDQISVSAATGAVTLSLPQNINTAADVEFSSAVLTGPNALSLGTAGVNAGSIGFKNGTNSFTTTVQSGTPSANLTFTLPSADGTSGQCLTTNASGVLSFSSCLSGGAGGSGGVTSLQGATGGSPLSGALSISNATSSGSAITIDDASATAKGIAQFTSTEFSVASGMVSLQNTVTKAGNTFNGINQLVLLNGSGFLPALNGSQLTTLNATNVTSGTLAVAQGGTGAGSFTTNGVLYGNGASIASTGAGTNGQCLVANTGLAPSFQTCTGAGGVSQLNAMTGAITIQNGTGIAVSNGVGTITISNSGVTSLQGNANQVSVSGSTGAITLSLPQDIHTGATVQFASATLTGAAALTVGQGSTNTGAIALKNGINNFTTLLQSGSPVADLAFTLPSTDGTSGQCLKTNASGALSFGDCLTGASGGSSGVVSLQGATGGAAISGALSINNATSGGSAITINDASTTAKGIAQFNNTDFSAAAGVISLGTVSVAKGGTGLTSYTTGDLLYASSSTTIAKLAAVASGSCLVSNGVGAAPQWGSCGLSGSGIDTKIAKFNSSGQLTDTNLAETGTTNTTLTYAGNLLVNAGSTFTGNLLDLQLSAVSKFRVTEAGNVTVAGTLGITGAATLSNTLGVTGVVTANGGIQSATATALDITANAASTWKTTTGDLTLQAGSGNISLGTSTTLTNSTALSIVAGGINQTLTLQGSGSGSVIAKSNTNSTNAFRIQNATGTDVLNVDTVKKSINVGSDASYTTSSGGVGYNGTFASRVDYATTTSVNFGLKSYDIDGDGDQDLVGSNGSTIIIQKNNGNGTFATPTTKTATLITSVTGATVFDINGDGDQDIIAYYGDDVASNVEILTNNGSGTFTDASTFYVAGPFGPNGATSADIDGDSDKDLIFNAGSAGLQIYKNNGSGTFTFDSNFSGVWYSLRFEDIDGDSDKDILGLDGVNNFHVSKNNGSGIFSAGDTYTAATSNTSGLAVADLDGDGDKDVVYGGAGSLYTRKNNGDGTFAAASSYVISGMTYPEIVTSDIDGDSDQDLIVSDSNGPQAYVIRNNGNATFAAKTDYIVVAAAAYGLVVTDLNADGAPDMAVRNGTTNLSVFLQVTTPASVTVYATASVTASAIDMSAMILQGISGQTADILRVQGSDGSPYLNVASNGNVGIGSVSNLSNSSYKLNVQGGMSVSANLLLTNAAGTETLLSADTGSNNRIVIGNAIGTGANTTILVLDAGTDATPPPGVAGAMYYDMTNNIFKCYTTGWFNCSGSGVSVVSGQGTDNTIAKFSSGQLADSKLTDDGTTLTYTGKAVINAPTGSTGNLLDVQLNTGSKFFVTTTGDTTIGGALTVGSIQSAAATALTLTANAASTWGTSAGKLTLQGGTGVDIKLPTLYNTDSTAFGLPTANTKNGELCVKYADATSNCTGLGGAVSSLGGTAGTIAVFSATNTIANSKLTDDGSTLTYTNNNAGFTGNLLDIKVTTTSKLTVDQSGALTIGGRLTVNSGGIYTGAGAGTLRLANDGTLQSVKIDTAGASVTVNSTGTPGALVANSAGLVSLATTASSSLCLVSNGTTGAPSFQTCPSGPATVSVNDSGLNGALVWMPQSNGWGSYTLQLSTGNSYTAASGDYLEYDVWCASGTNCNAGISNADAQLGTDQNNVANTAPDMNNINQADISSYATGKWYHRKVALTAGTNMSTLYLRWNIQGAGGATFYFKGIGITNSTTVKLRIYDGTKPSGTFALGGTGSRPCITSCGGGIEELRWASHDSIDVTNTSVFRGKLYVGCGSGISKCMSTASAGGGSAQTMATYLLNNNAAAALGVIGNGYATGSFTTNASPDIAETIDTAPDVETGDLVVPDPTHPERAIKSHKAYDTSVLGAISDGTGGFLINAYGNQRDYTEGSNGYTGKPLVIGGRIKIKVSTQNGVIRIGDPITTSDTPGYGMKATHAGNIVGYALDNLDADGMVLVYLNLTYYAPSVADTLQAQAATFGSLNVSGTATIENLTVTGLATVHNLAVGGHIITTGGQPTDEPQVAVGRGASVSVDGTDTLGTITITTGSDPKAGEMTRIIFSEVYGKAPRVVLSASNDNAAGMRFYKGVTTPDGFMLNFKDAPQANTTYTIDYFIGE